MVVGWPQKKQTRVWTKMSAHRHKFLLQAMYTIAIATAHAAILKAVTHAPAMQALTASPTAAVTAQSPIVAAVSLLTVAMITKTDVKMRMSVRRTRIDAASRLSAPIPRAPTSALADMAFWGPAWSFSLFLFR